MVGIADWWRQENKGSNVQSTTTSEMRFQLGFTWGEPPSMAGVNLGDVQLFLERGNPSPDGCSVYFVVGNADDLFEYQRANGVEILQAPGERRKRRLSRLRLQGRQGRLAGRGRARHSHLRHRHRNVHRRE